jgi:hypothetical protein
MPQCQFPIFCYFCVSEKLHRKYSQNSTKQKPNIQKFTKASREPKRRRSGATRGPHNRAARPRPWLRPLCVRLPRSTSDDARSPIKTPRQEKPKYLIRLKRIYNFLCFMLVFTPFALCFVTLHGVFMQFLDLTY